MKSYKQFLKEDSSRISQYLSTFPPQPGTSPIPEGHVRLYHQTREENLDKIQKEGIKLSKTQTPRGGYPEKGIWHHLKGWYGDPTEYPTVEFSIPKEEYTYDHKELGRPLQRDIKPQEIIAIHKPWHKYAKEYVESPSVMQSIKLGEFDKSLEKYPDDDEMKAVQHIKDNY